MVGYEVHGVLFAVEVLHPQVEQVFQLVATGEGEAEAGLGAGVAGVDRVEVGGESGQVFGEKELLLTVAEEVVRVGEEVSLVSLLPTCFVVGGPGLSVREGPSGDLDVGVLGVGEGGVLGGVLWDVATACCIGAFVFTP